MLIDTSGFFAIHSEADKFHSEANRLCAKSRQRLTTNYVLAEYVALTLVRGLAREKVVAFSEEILRDETVEIVWIQEELHAQAVELLKERADKTYSLCDAASFVLMRERVVTEALEVV